MENIQIAAFCSQQLNGKEVLKIIVDFDSKTLIYSCKYVFNLHSPDDHRVHFPFMSSIWNSESSFLAVLDLLMRTGKLLDDCPQLPLMGKKNEVFMLLYPLAGSRRVTSFYAALPARRVTSSLKSSDSNKTVKNRLKLTMKENSSSTSLALVKAKWTSFF